MNLPEQFVSCDWGTSNFRIRLVDSKDLRIIQEHKTNVGVSKLYQQSLNQKEVSREDFFKNYLLRQLDILTDLPKDDILIIASGMITSAIGMKALPYASVPQPFNGANINCSLFSLDHKIQTLLISGIRTESDIMRGEETQAIGIIDHISDASEGVIILPGTHSKHIRFSGDNIIDFSTFMSGELFEILSTTGLLSLSVKNTVWDPKFSGIFLEGVQKGINDEFMTALFSIRGNDILKSTSKEMNFYFLSGLVIGSELSYLKKNDQKIFLGASGILRELYLLALVSNLPSDRFTCFRPEIIDNALLIGQKKIAQSYA
ncbi:2-dehydro-3-deoxygalactonokinase [uncultured Aquimarina sp.]|uniref:2-dehydro-3-deoxygalactonokinase n=1 Tax=uncultured Aquimarina sp. TaxID=575652 RepID=UPI002636874D|nr:2-dehydro-3-deoxygalactonokinase [uncultured Aquimarina sp.]